jgi:protein-tyrosine-phosphatase/predicted ATP-grasp superfamily ATP-dependent carboligase
MSASAGSGRCRALVVGDDTRSFLTLVRSLGRAGHVVHVAPFDRRSPALRSRYVAAVHRLPFHLGDGSAWRAALRDLVDAHGLAVVVPCDERALLPLDAHRDAFADVVLAIPDRRAIDVFYDKHRTRELAARHGIAVAPGRLLRPDDTATGLAREFGLPLALKPRCSYRLDGLHARNKVALADDAATLATELARRTPEDTLIEAFAPGIGVGVSVLAADGDILQAFEHHRDHDDLAVGGSYYRHSAPLTPVLLFAVERLVADVGYTGIAMFEFRLDRVDGRYALLEVNARPWGSMPLPVALGVDFPERWRRLLTAGERTPPVRYRRFVYGRNLVPDLEHMLLDLRRAANRPRAVARAAGGAALGLGRVLTGRERWDTLTRDDPRPGLVELGEAVRTAAGKVGDRLPAAATRRRWRRRWRRRRLWRRLARAGARPHVVFVCHGNICRSPFAAELARRTVGERWRIESAGILPVEDRPSPPEAREVAAEHGIDLAPHRSRHLDPELAAADLLVVFDQKNALALEQRYPEAAGRTFKLGQLLDDADDEIADPLDRGRETFRRVYDRIATAVARLVAATADHTDEGRG